MKHEFKANPEAEIGVIGVLVKDGSPESITVKKHMLALKESYFLNPLNKELFNIIKKRFDNEQPFDLISLMDLSMGDGLYTLLKQSIVGGHYSLNMLDTYIETLKCHDEMRKQKQILEKAICNTYDESIPHLASNILMEGIKEAADVHTESTKHGATFKEIYQEYLAGAFKGSEVIECGIEQFGQIKNCGLIVIAGGSGVGKTYFSIYFMDQIIKYQPEKQFLFFSLEMMRNEIWDRYLAIKHDKPSDKLTDHDRSLALNDGLVFDQPRIDIDFIETIAHIQSMQKPLSVIVVDYVALVTSNKKYDRDDLKIADITQRLAALSMELNCIVIALSQVNREPDKRKKDDRCPYPADVADSVGSVRSSSLWIGIDRPELYDQSHMVKNLFVAKCRKSRHGDNFEAWFDFNQGRFKERNKPYFPTDKKNPLNNLAAKCQPSLYKKELNINKQEEI